MPTRRLPETTPTPTAHPASLPNPCGICSGSTRSGLCPGRAHPGWTREAIPGPDPVVWDWIAPLLPFADEKEELPGHFLKGGGNPPPKGMMNYEPFARRGESGDSHRPPPAVVSGAGREDRTRKYAWPPGTSLRALPAKPVRHWPSGTRRSLPAGPTGCRDHGLSGVPHAFSSRPFRWTPCLAVRGFCRIPRDGAGCWGLAAAPPIADASDSRLLQCC